MPRGKRSEDLTTLRMALVGYQAERDKIDAKIREIQAKLKGAPAETTLQGIGQKAPASKRALSPAARKRIAAAQKKRWAEHRKAAAAKAE